MAMSIPSITCTFIGDSGVGKSTLLEYENNHRLPTVGVNMVCYQGENLLLKCWDTSGQNKFKSVVRMFANKCDVVVYVFDASSEVSFNSIVEKYRNMLTQKHRQYFVICNKIDKVEQELVSHYRQIVMQEAKHLVFLECNALEDGKKTMDTIAEMVERLPVVPPLTVSGHCCSLM